MQILYMFQPFDENLHIHINPDLAEAGCRISDTS